MPQINDFSWNFSSFLLIFMMILVLVYSKITNFSSIKSKSLKFFYFNYII